MGLGILQDTLKQSRLAVMISVGALIALSIIWAVIRMSGGTPSLEIESAVIYCDLDQKTISLIDHDMASGPATSPRPGAENALIAAV